MIEEPILTFTDRDYVRLIFILAHGFSNYDEIKPTKCISLVLFRSLYA
jgi:hypothetical protein